MPVSTGAATPDFDSEGAEAEPEEPEAEADDQGGAHPVSAGQELDRVLPVIDALKEARERGGLRNVPVSIDTRKAEVADEALRRGCHMINDVSAASDPEMVEVLHRHPHVPIILMHMKGDPKTMQEAPH